MGMGLTAMPISLQDASYFSLRAAELVLHSPSFLKLSCKERGNHSISFMCELAFSAKKETKQHIVASDQQLMKLALNSL